VYGTVHTKSTQTQIKYLKDTTVYYPTTHSYRFALTNTSTFRSFFHTTTLSTMGSVFGRQNPESCPEEEQKRLQKRYGVLCPPIFTCAKDDGYASTPDSMPISSQQLYTIHINANPTLSPSIVEYLWSMNAGNNMLTEYMTPGLFFSGELLLLNFDF
jgi:hypothetical protein